jgi:hypothetical protein
MANWRRTFGKFIGWAANPIKSMQNRPMICIFAFVLLLRFVFFCLNLQREKSNEARVVRVIDMIVFNNPPDGFSVICKILHQSSAQCARLAHELEADLRLERGEIRPRQDLLEEAASMIHR